MERGRERRERTERSKTRRGTERKPKHDRRSQLRVRLCVCVGVIKGVYICIQGVPSK